MKGLSLRKSGAALVGSALLLLPAAATAQNPMRNSSQHQAMPAAGNAMSGTGGMCCGMGGMKKGAMAKSRHATSHRARSRAASRPHKTMPAAPKSMPMKDDM